ncbi:MAG TPA: hypothetical protein VHS59_10635, partial [Bacillota bacterium]|nr:hypothetical protein [Bacillota bacterium]
IQGITRISENYFSAGKQQTVTWFVSQVLGIPAVQLEINKEYRVPRQNQEAYCRMLAAIIEAIRRINQHTGKGGRL